MKKIIVLLLVLISLSSCDDGELTLESFNFEGQSIQKCDDNLLLFKTKNDELLLISLSDEEYTKAFKPEVTGDTPREVFINNENVIIYRKYTGAVTSNTICTLIPASTPTVAKEWLATGGTISVETNEIRDETTDEVIAHTHNITFLNVLFANAENSFGFESYIYGNHRIDVN